MKIVSAKEKRNSLFSYLDLILIILAFLIFSLGIGLFFEDKENNQNAEAFFATLEEALPEDLRESIPRVGDRLYREGKSWGTVSSVQLLEESDGLRLLVSCRLTQHPEGETMTVETANFILKMKIISVKGK